MAHDNKESSGLVSVISRQAGTVAGTSVLIGKKIAGRGFKTVKAAKGWLKQPLKNLTPARDKKSRTTSETSVLKSKDEQETGRRKAAKALIAALESEVAAAQRHLEKSRKKEQDIKSQSPSDPSNVRPDEETALSDRAKEELEVVLTKEKAESAMKPTVSQSVEELNVKTQEQPSQAAHKVEMPSAVAATDKEVQAAVFPNITDKIIFMKALSDIASEHPAARADAARAMAGVSHELSVRVLVAQMAREPSPQVRQECIKALTTLGKEEGLPAVENALTDESASVRLAAVRGLYHLGGAESAPALARMFSDESEGVRRRAASCVGWLGQKELAIELLPLLTDSSVSVRRAAVEAMGNLGSRQVVSALIERLNDPEKSVRKAVLDALERTTGKRMREPFSPDEKSLQHLIARWREWWKEELLG